MAQVIGPPANDIDEGFEAMQKLMRDSEVTRSAHFFAKQRKERTFQIIGVSVLVLNIIFGSWIEARFANNPNAITIIITLLVFLAAVLAGIQAFPKFRKAVECHIKSECVYSSINHRLNLIMAEYQEQPANRPALIGNFKVLNDEFLKANDDATVCIPADLDFDKARAGIKARES